MGKKLNQSKHSFTWIIDKAATATEKGSKHEQCTVCNYAKTAVEIPIEETQTSYSITEGAGSSYVLQSGNSLTIRGNGEFSKFTGIKVDGVLIGKENYDVKSGSSSKKSIDTLAKEVIAGKWGNGEERKQKLTAAGYDYNAVQKRVNEMLS